MPRNSADEELKKSIEYISDKIDELSKTKTGNLTNFSNGYKIAENCRIKDKQIQMLEDKIDQLEQYTRQENIIITGLKTSHKSCI